MEETNVTQNQPQGTEAGQAATAQPKAPPAQEENPMSMMLPLIILWVGVFYFFFIRPQKKKDKERREKIDSLKKGDRVVSIGGIHGTIVNLANDTITLKVDEKTGTTMKFARAAVNDVVSEEKEEKNS